MDSSTSSSATPRIFDVHHHAGSIDTYLGDAAVSFTREAMLRDIDARLRFMDAWGIEQALLMPSSGQAHPRGIDDERRANDWVAEYRTQHPDRFPVAVGSISPSYEDAAARETERCLDEIEMRGMVWHHRFMGCTINHHGMNACLDVLDRRGSPAMVHVIAESTLEAPWRLEVLADAYPSVRFVALDAFSSPGQSSWMQYIAGRHPNIWFDTGVLASVAHGLVRFVEMHGAERLLFGTDHYSSPALFQTPFALQEVLACPFSAEAKAKILGGNARAMFGLK